MVKKRYVDERGMWVEIDVKEEDDTKICENCGDMIIKSEWEKTLLFPKGWHMIKYCSSKCQSSMQRKKIQKKKTEERGL